MSKNGTDGCRNESKNKLTCLEENVQEDEEKEHDILRKRIWKRRTNEHGLKGKRRRRTHEAKVEEKEPSNEQGKKNML